MLVVQKLQQQLEDVQLVMSGGFGQSLDQQQQHESGSSETIKVLEQKIS